jgi:tetratricopeptide (TPR) repeat protein
MKLFATMFNLRLQKMLAARPGAAKSGAEARAVQTLRASRRAKKIAKRLDGGGSPPLFVVGRSSNGMAGRFYMKAGLLWLCIAAVSFQAKADDGTNFPTPVTARDFYNAGTKLFAGKKFAEAEKMFQSALAAQDEPVQSRALYNLGQARFAAGSELLKKGPDAHRVAAQGNAALAAGEQAISQSKSALAENNLDKLIAAYLEGRGVRHDLREAEKAVAAAMETYGKTLIKWQRAVDDFKGTAELNPAETNAAHNAEVIERDMAKLVDSVRKMQEMMGMMGKQRQDLGKLLSKLKGQIPAPNAPPGAAGDEEEDEEGMQPDSLAGQKENAAREGDQMQVPLSPDQAGQILDGISLDGSRRLPMSDKQGAPPKEKTGRNW